MWSVLLCSAILGIAPVDESNMRAMVAGLGSSRFAEREAAGQALLALGRQALPALETARKSPDAEVRARAAMLVNRIEASLLLEPTIVRLAEPRVTLREALAAIEHASGVRVQVDTRTDHPDLTSVTFPETRPGLTLWETIGHLEQTLSTRAVSDPPQSDMPLPGRESLRLHPVASATPWLTSAQGPLRTRVTGIHHERDRRFEPLAEDPGQPSTFQIFQVRLQIRSEPRLLLLPIGPPRVVEAVDDESRSLIPGTTANPFLSTIEIPPSFSEARTTIDTELDLHLPDRPGRTIRRLRGVQTLQVAERRDDSIVADLSDARGKVYTGGMFNLEVRDFRTSQPDGQMVLDLVVSRATAGSSGEPASLVFGADAAQPFDRLIQQQIEISDSVGKPFRYFPAEIHADGPQWRASLVVLPREDNERPRYVRFFDLIQAQTDLSFDFRDIPLP